MQRIDDYVNRYCEFKPIKSIDFCKKNVKEIKNQKLKIIISLLKSNSKIMIIDDDVFNIKGMQMLF